MQRDEIEKNKMLKSVFNVWIVTILNSYKNLSSI